MLPFFALEKRRDGRAAFSRGARASNFVPRVEPSALAARQTNADGEGLAPRRNSREGSATPGEGGKQTMSVSNRKTLSQLALVGVAALGLTLVSVGGSAAAVAGHGAANGAAAAAGNPGHSGGGSANACNGGDCRNPNPLRFPPHRVHYGRDCANWAPGFDAVDGPDWRRCRHPALSDSYDWY